MSYTINEIIDIFNNYSIKLKDNDISINTNNKELTGNVSLYKNIIKLYYEYDSTYVAINFKLYNEKKEIILEVKVESNKEMKISDFINKNEELIEDSAMNNIIRVGLLYSELEETLYVCINYICYGYQYYVYKLKIDIIKP